MTFNCLIVGVGGQGTILAARLIGDAAIAMSLFVRGAETIGMAQRGGSVTSHVRMGETADGVNSPLILPGRADVILAFDPIEALRSAGYLSANGFMAVCDRAAVRTSESVASKKSDGVAGEAAESAYCGGALPDAAGLSRTADTIEQLRESVEKLYVFDGESFAAKFGARCLNVAMLGAVTVSGAFPFGQDRLRAAIESRVPAKALDMNLRAMEYGVEYGVESRCRI